MDDTELLVNDVIELINIYKVNDVIIPKHKKALKNILLVLANNIKDADDTCFCQFRDMNIFIKWNCSSTTHTPEEIKINYIDEQLRGMIIRHHKCYAYKSNYTYNFIKPLKQAIKHMRNIINKNNYNSICQQYFHDEHELFKIDRIKPIDGLPINDVKV